MVETKIKKIFLRFAQNKIEAGNDKFAGIVIKALRLPPRSLLKENEKDGISTKEVAERILRKIDIILIKENEQNIKG